MEGIFGTSSYLPVMLYMAKVGTYWYAANKKLELFGALCQRFSKVLFLGDLTALHLLPCLCAMTVQKRDLMSWELLEWLMDLDPLPQDIALLVTCVEPALCERRSSYRTLEVRIWIGWWKREQRLLGKRWSLQLLLHSGHVEGNNSKQQTCQRSWQGDRHSHKRNACSEIAVLVVAQACRGQQLCYARRVHPLALRRTQGAPLMSPALGQQLSWQDALLQVEIMSLFVREPIDNIADEPYHQGLSSN